MTLVTRRSPPSSPRGLTMEIVRKTASFTVDENMCEAVLQCDSASPIAVTLPKNLPIGFACMVQQAGAGAVTFAAASGATMVNRLSATGVAGQYGVVLLYVHKGTEWLLSGDAA